MYMYVYIYINIHIHIHIHVQIKLVFYSPTVGTAVAQWLRCCATNRKVAGSIPAGHSLLYALERRGRAFSFVRESSFRAASEVQCFFFVVC